MSEAERDDFDCDQSKINWTQYIALFIRGMSIWCMKEDNVAPKHYLLQIARKNRFPMQDINLMLSRKTFFTEKDSGEYDKNILSEARFQDYFLI